MEATPAELELQTLVCLVAELTQHLGVEPEVRGFPPEDLLYTWILSNFVFWVKKKGSLYTLTGHARPNTGAFTLHAGSVEAAARVASNVLRRFNRSPEKGLLSMGSDSIRAARVEAAPPYVLATLNETSFQLPLIEAPAVGGCVALFNLRGDWALTEHVGCALARRLSAATEAVDVWVMPAGKEGESRYWIEGHSLRETDPTLYLQIYLCMHPPNATPWFQSKADVERLIAEGTKTVPVPLDPITVYATKNREEAFCEALGMLVAYGPRAVPARARFWLEEILPEIRIAASRRVVGRFSMEVRDS
jgi:hypothetical protein